MAWARRVWLHRDETCCGSCDARRPDEREPSERRSLVRGSRNGEYCSSRLERHVGEMKKGESDSRVVGGFDNRRVETLGEMTA